MMLILLSFNKYFSLSLVLVLICLNGICVNGGVSSPRNKENSDPNAGNHKHNLIS